jgi:hypothetical protein
MSSDNEHADANKDNCNKGSESEYPRASSVCNQRVEKIPLRQLEGYFHGSRLFQTVGFQTTKEDQRLVGETTVPEDSTVNQALP